MTPTSLRLRRSGLCALFPVLFSCGAQPDQAPGPQFLAESTSSAAASFAGVRSSYAITRTSLGYSVTSTASGAGPALTVGDTALLTFADATVNLAIGKHALTLAPANLTMLVELYIAFFNRVPDADGLLYWIGQFQSGRTIDQIAENFYAAAVQFTSLTGYAADMSNADFVRIIYKNVLGRSGTTAPPDADVNYWAGELASGRASKGSLVRSMLASAHSFKGDATWGWVANLLDNKFSAGYYFAVEQGLNFLTAADSISKGMEIAGAVTSTSADAAKAMVTGAQAGLTLPQLALAAMQPDYLSVAARTEVAVPLVAPVPDIRLPGQTYMYRYSGARVMALADLDGDGLDDIIVAPTFFRVGPKQLMELWLNKGSGRFENATATLLEGAVPVTGSVNNIFVADLNRDGRPDIMLVDSGLEDKDCGVSPGCDGATNILLMSQPNGKLKDVSATALPGNVPSFNHVSAMGDVNRDGLTDFVIARLGGSTMEGEGVVVWLNRGDGTFSFESTSLLPDEVAYLPNAVRYSAGFKAAHPPPFDRQNTGSTGVGDLDGDGQNEILTCSYAGGDSYTNDRTLRIHRRQPDGKFVGVAKIGIPAALKANTGNGCATIALADFNGDGRVDIMLNWEDQHGNGTSIQLLKNLGNFTFSDVTIETLGSYQSNYSSFGYNWNILVYSFKDINGDGLPDIVLRSNGIGPELLARGSPVSWINLGGGRFVRQALRINGAATDSAAVAAMLKCEWCSYLPLYGRLQAHAAGDMKVDMLLWSTAENNVTVGGKTIEASVTLRSLFSR